MSSRSRSSSRDGGSDREKSRSASPRSPSNSPPRRRSPSKSPPRRRSPVKSQVRRRSPSPRNSSRSPRRRRSPSPRRSPRRTKRDRDTRRRSRSHERKERRRSPSPKRSRRSASKEKTPPPAEPEKQKKEPVDLLRTRAGGAYIPPAKLKLMQEQMADKSGEQYQRMNWERLKKKMHGLVNKINTGNLVAVVRELLQENVIRGKGLLARSIIQAQAFSPIFSNVYSALTAVINSKFPHVGELVLRRLVVQFKRSFRRNDKGTTVSVSKFIAHLINQQVAHELLALEIMMLMLESPTEDSVEVAIAFLKECGAKLQEVAPRALDSVFARLRDILTDNEGQRIQYMIEAVMIIRKDKFKAYPIVIDELDLIDEDDQTTHTMSLEDAVDPENGLNVFKFDPEFEKNEATYDEIRKEIIGDVDDSDEEEEDDEGEGEGGDDEENKEDAAPQTTEIIDNTEQNLVAFRREVYLTIQSSLDYQEAAHKLLKMNVKPELEVELCHMLVDCCTQSRTYERFYGLLCERFCRLKKEFQDTFEQVARDTYATVHRFEITKLRNISRLISHLLYTDAISWMVLADIKLTEEDTTSSGRIYIKYIFQELVESMGLAKLYARIQDPTLQAAFDGLFPRDNPQNSRFAINFFTLIGLGGLTLDLREWLEKGMKKKQQAEEEEEESSSSDSSDSDSSDSSDSDSDSSDSDSSSSSSSSDSDDDKKKKKKKASKKKDSSKSKENKPTKATAEVVVKEEEVSPKRHSPVKEKRRERSAERGGREQRDERRKGVETTRRADDGDWERRRDERRKERSPDRSRRDRSRDRNRERRDDRRRDEDRRRRRSISR